MKTVFSVLVAEDEPLMRQYLQDKLSTIHASCTVTNTVKNGEMALDAVRAGKYDLLITDIKMPVMDGITLVSRLREQGSSMPVIILTGYDEFEYARASLRLGVTEYLLKPLNDAELHNVLEKLCSRLNSASVNVSLPADWSPESIRDFISKCFTERSSEHSVLVEKAAAYISEHYSDPITQSDVAEMLGVTPAYLSSVFHEAKGESYSQFLTRLRMTQAALLLKTNPTLTIQNVATMAGYVTDKHFIKVFKNFFGITPNEYRKGKDQPQ